MKKIFTIILVATMGFFFTGCDHYLDVNKNIDAPDEQQLPDYLYLAGIESALQGLYWDIRATGPMTQMFATSSYTGFCNYYWTPSDSGGEMWRVVYWLQGKNLENMIRDASAAERWTLAGMGWILKAHSWDVLTKEVGEMPCQQAFEPGRLSFDYDYQPLIYDSVRTWAERGIEYLERSDANNYGNTLKESDIIYHGDKAKWIKFGHGVICRNLASLTRKSDFVSSYANDLIAHGKLAMQTLDDDCMIETPGGSAQAKFNAYNNFWGPTRGNMANSYWQAEYIVDIMCGKVPLYNHETGNREESLKNDHRTWYYPYELNPNQIICDTMVEVTGHFDPRSAAKLSTRDDRTYENVADKDSVKYLKHFGGQFTSQTGYQGWNAGNIWGRNGYSGNVNTDGTGRWLFRDDAPYIIMTSAEIQFEMAEAYWYMGDKTNALACWKKGVELDMNFTAKWIQAGSKLAGKNAKGEDIFVENGARPGGDHITVAVYNALATEYLNGPFVGGITASTLTLSHIMMQKYVHLWPWGAYEAWVDLRKYHYDIDYSGDYPSKGNGWENTYLHQKWDEDATKVYKGFYLKPAQVEGRRSAYNSLNEGAPAYRITPRYNSEYMWNKQALRNLKPMPALIYNADKDSDTYTSYHCSIPWFAYPGDMPESL
jgi:hypothetical protein